MNTPKLAIFDMDGLIFDSERLFMGFLQKAAADLGYEITPEKYALTLGVGGDTLAARVREIYGADYPHQEISCRARLAMNTWTEHHTIPVKEGIPELLEFFTARQIPCCVASSTPTDHVNRYLEQAGLARYFSRITGGDQVSHSKPDPEIFLLSCRHFDIAPEDALVLEDSENGLLAAHNGKIPAICIPDMKYPAAQYRDYAVYIAGSARDVITYFS